MEYCPECGTEARTDVTYCPGCGTDLTEYRKWSSPADAETGTDANAEQAQTPADEAESETTPNGPDGERTAARAAADENASSEMNAGGGGRQQRSGRAGDAAGRGGEPRTNSRDEPAQGQTEVSQQEAGSPADRQQNRSQAQNHRQTDRQNAQPASGQGRGRQGANQPRGQTQGSQPQGGNPRRGAQGGRAAAAQQGGQPVPGQQQGAAAGANQPVQGQGRGAPAGAASAQAPGAVGREPSLLDRIKALPFKQSAATGAGLYVASFLATYLTFAVDALVINGSGHELSASTLLPGTEVSPGNPLEMWQLVGWLLYSGHNVAIERSVDGSTMAVEVLGKEYWTQFAIPQLVTPVLYTVIPLAVLAAGGFAFVRYLDGDATPVTETTDAALLGASILVGYVVLAAVGASLVSVSQGGASTGPVLEDVVIWTALFAGGAGAVGGVAAVSLGDDAPAETAPSGNAR